MAGLTLTNMATSEVTASAISKMQQQKVLEDRLELPFWLLWILLVTYRKHGTRVLVLCSCSAPVVSIRACLVKEAAPTTTHFLVMEPRLP